MRHHVQLDELHVVSDLHLGGRRGFQIFASTPALVRLIDDIALRRSPGAIGLLINGDFIDFLAEEPNTYFDADGATTKIDRIAADPSFAPVFDALKRLLTTPGRGLAINLGNHDLELSLPWVREHLTALLCGADVAARSRLMLVTDGTGFRCRVGRANIVCVHGNEVDSWNVADYEHLRRIGRDVHFGRPIEPWKPNAGTQMVIDVMNRIKQDYPFVDLLKPETEAVLPILAALNPQAHRSLLDLAGIAGRKAWDMARMKTGFLDASPPGADAANAPARAPYRPMAELGSTDAGASAAALMAQVEAAWRQRVTPISLVRGTQSQQLGFWSATANWATGKPRHEVLREALSYLDKDRSFDPSQPDDTFRQLDELIGIEADIVIAGHTHLERSLPRRIGGGRYFNSGTWAGLMRIAPDVRQDEARFKQLFGVLAGGGLAALEQQVGLIERRNTAVAVWVDAKGATQAELRHMRATATPGNECFERVAGTQYSTM